MKSKKKKNRKSYLVILALIFFLSGFLIFFLTYFPLFREEIKYRLIPKNQKISVILPEEKPKTSGKYIYPVDTNFAIVIPKIKVNTKVIPNVDPNNSRIYQWELTKGVAHAKGTSLPDEKGNVFIFAHSAGNFYEASRFNAIFYLLTKLEKGDEIYLFYKNQKYRYKVSKKVFSDPSDLSYLTGNPDQNTLTLMTCWPPGTTFKRLIVLADLDQ